MSSGSCLGVIGCGGDHTAVPPLTKGAATALFLVVASVTPGRATPVDVPQDVVFVFDGSGSLEQAGFDTVIAFMQNIVDTHAQDPVHPIRFGAILFSTNVETVYNLTDDQTPMSITDALEDVLYPAGQTHTRDALNAALDMFNNQSDEPNPKTLLLITDGAPFPTLSQRVCHNGNMKTNLDAADVQVNIVGVGDTMLHNDDRYIRAEEFIEIVRGMWKQLPYSFKGQFYDVNDAELLLGPATPEPPEVFTASRSPRGLDMVAQIADWWFVDYDKEAETTEEVMESLAEAMESVKERADRLGRKVRFAYNPFVCFGATVEEAKARAEQLVTVDGSDADVRKLLNRIGPAMKSGCVGPPDQVRRQVELFREMGIELLLFKFVPNIEETQSIGREIIAPLRKQWGEA